MRKLSAFTASVVAACSMALHAHADEATVTPYRPSVSTPATLSAPGWLEVEAGGQRSRGLDPTVRDSVPYSLKLAFTPDWGVRVSGDAWVRERQAGGDTVRGLGNTSVVVKRRFEVDEASAFGAEIGVKLPTAHGDPGGRHSDVGITAIYSADFAHAWHTDLNASVTHLGGASPGEGSLQKAWAASLSRNITSQWTAGAELSGTQQRGAPGTSQFLLAVSYLVSPALALDCGVSKGLNTASGGWSAFTGLTFLAGRLF